MVSTNMGQTQDLLKDNQGMTQGDSLRADIGLLWDSRSESVWQQQIVWEEWRKGEGKGSANLVLGSAKVLEENEWFKP